MYVCVCVCPNQLTDLSQTLYERHATREHRLLYLNCNIACSLHSFRAISEDVIGDQTVQRYLRVDRGQFLVSVEIYWLPQCDLQLIV